MYYTYLNEEAIKAIITLFGIVFCGGFTLTVTLHYIGYAIFGVMSLLNIKN